MFFYFETVLFKVGILVTDNPRIYSEFYVQECFVFIRIGFGVRSAGTQVLDAGDVDRVDVVTYNAELHDAHDGGVVVVKMFDPVIVEGREITSVLGETGNLLGCQFCITGFFCQTINIGIAIFAYSCQCGVELIVEIIQCVEYKRVFYRITVVTDGL